MKGERDTANMTAPVTYQRLRGLTLAQRNAIDLLVAGLNDRAAAERLGLSRETLTRWRNYDPIFQTSLNERRAALWSGAADGVRAAIPLALDAMREQLRVGARRDRLALDLLTRIGLLGSRSGRSRAAGPAAPMSPLDPLGIGQTTMEELLDAEVRQMRVASAAQHGGCVLPTVDAPITDEDRESACRRLQFIAAEDPNDLPDPEDPPPTDHT